MTWYTRQMKSMIFWKIISIFSAISFCLSGCLKKHESQLAYYHRLQDSIVFKSKDTVRNQLGPPHIREKSTWYYFDVSKSIVLTLHFSKYHEVYFYSEQYYQEENYHVWIPRLIHSLQSPDEKIKERAYRVLDFIVREVVYRSATPQPNLWDPIPLDHPSYKAWNNWWETIGKYQNMWYLPSYEHLIPKKEQ